MSWTGRMTTNQADLITRPRLGRYEIDTNGSGVAFKTRHLFGLASARGTFAIRSGTVNVAEPLAESTVQVEIATASFHTGSVSRDRDVRSAHFLDADRYPVMTFTSGGVQGSTLEGTLTVRDVARPVSLTFEQPDVAAGSFTARATTRIDRTEFGVTAKPRLAGQYLDVSLEIRCVRT